MESKTPEELADDVIKIMKRKYTYRDMTDREEEIAYSVYLAGHAEGYHSRDTEIADLKKQLNKAQDPYAE